MTVTGKMVGAFVAGVVVSVGAAVVMRQWELKAINAQVLAGTTQGHLAPAGGAYNVGPVIRTT